MNDAPVWVITVTVVTVLSVVFGFAAWGLTGLERLRGRRKALRMGCSCCGESSKSVAKLIAGPGVAICDACTRLATEHLGEHLRGEHDHPDTDARGLACSFCKNGASEVGVLATWHGGGICDHCLSMCRDILEADARNATDAPRA